MTNSHKDAHFDIKQKKLDDDDLLDDDFFQDEVEIIENTKSKIKILIVDDEKEVHSVTTLALSDFDYEGHT